MYPLEESINHFAFEAYKALDRENPDRNIFFSPVSLSAAFGMVYEGARGKTAEEIKDVFGFSVDFTEHRKAFSALQDRSNDNKQDCQLSIINALWAEKRFELLVEYHRAVSAYLDGKVDEADFVNQPERERNAINSWVENRTEGKISDLLPSGSINAETRLVITNAIYFMGEWVNKFDSDETLEEDFYLAQGKTVRTPMMCCSGDVTSFGYVEDDKAQIISMPYWGGEISMVAVLPRDGRLTELEKNVSPTLVAKWLGKMQLRDVFVKFPKFKFATEYSLEDHLKAMGMPTVFSTDADFSGISEKSGVMIDKVIHKACLDVYEEGTEAAAATALMEHTGACFPVTEFIADTPFMLFIIEDLTGAILFMGRVTDPTR